MRTLYLLVLPLLALTVPVHAQTPEALTEARARLEAATAPATRWDGPIAGPTAQPGKTIIYISADQRNGGALGVGAGLAEAAAAIGWTFKIIDGQGSVPQQTAAVGQAIALRPDGIVLGTIDAVGQRATLQRAVENGIKVVGWHSGPKPGPIDSPALFTNITTPPEQIALTAADYVIARSNGTAQVAIMRNNETLIGRTKGDLMRTRIEACTGCAVLSFDVIPIAETSTRVTPLTASLMQRFNGKLTWMLAINDLYFDFAVPALRSAGIGPDGPPLMGSGGDGSVVRLWPDQGRAISGGNRAGTLELAGLDGDGRAEPGLCRRPMEWLRQRGAPGDPRQRQQRRRREQPLRSRQRLPRSLQGDLGQVMGAADLRHAQPPGDRPL